MGGPRLAGLVVFAVALWAQHAGLVGVFYDDGIYVSLARSLAAGEGYVNGHLPAPFPGVHYPPLYPWALSLLWRLWPSFPDNVALFQLFDALCLGVAAWITAAHARRLSLPPGARVPLVVSGLVAFPVLAIVSVRFSEPLFLALAAGALALADRAGRSWRLALAAGGLAGLAVLTRSIGIAVVGGIVLAYLSRRRWRQAGFAALGAGVLMAPWVAWIARHAGRVPDVLQANYGTYASELDQAGMSAFAAPEVLGVMRPFAALLLPPVPELVWYGGAAAIAALLLWGVIVMWRETRALGAVLALYVLLVALWPYAPDRFIWIVLPWLLLALALGVRAAWGATSRGVVRAGVAALASVLVVTGLVREASSLSGRQFAATAESISVPFRLLTAVVAAEAPPEAVIASADEALMALYTGRRAVPAQLFRWRGRTTEELDPGATRRALCALGASVIAVTGPGDGAAAIAEGLAPHFRLRDGPALYYLSCD